MPVYTYRCPACFYAAEIEVSYSKYPMLSPPICGDGNKMERVYVPTPVKFVGQGFASNDLKKDGSNE